MAISFFGGAVTTGSTTEPGPQAVTPPASMVAGDLVILIGSTADVTGTMSVSTTGGQTWNSLTQYSTTNNRHRVFWCQFNGTWGANPALSTSGGIQDFAVGMYVFRPNSGSSTWILDTAPASATYTAPGSAPGNVTNTGITTSNANTVVLSLWSATGALPTWAVQTAGWSDGSPSKFESVFNRWINTGVAYQIFSAAGATGNVTSQESTNTAGIGAVMAWAEQASGASAPVGRIYQVSQAVNRAGTF